MEKLLHERLRDTSHLEDLADKIGVEPNDNENPIVLFRRCMNCLADEIERTYIPRPRFEDGEPVQFGDEVEGCNGRIHEITVFNDGSGSIHGIDDQDYEGVIFAEREDQDRFCNIKRPTPKVYDADGVEIKVGDKVWTTMYDQWFVVDRIAKNKDGEPIVMVSGMGSGLFPNTCYHERPVFDAEGVRICKGDTVWSIDPTCKVSGTVHGFDYRGIPVISWNDGSKASSSCGNTLTHREPDSLEKLRDDMKDVWENWTPKEMDGEWVDRLTALIERGA